MGKAESPLSSFSAKSSPPNLFIYFSFAVQLLFCSFSYCSLHLFWFHYIWRFFSPDFHWVTMFVLQVNFKRKVTQCMRWSVIGFIFSLCSGLPIVIRHSPAVLCEALSLQILASLHLLSIVCLPGYSGEKCTHIRKTDLLSNTEKNHLSLSFCELIMKTKKLFRENYTQCHLDKTYCKKYKKTDMFFLCLVPQSKILKYNTVNLCFKAILSGTKTPIDTFLWRKMCSMN